MKLELWTHWSLTITMDSNVHIHPVHINVGRAPVLYKLDERVFHHPTS